MKTTKAVRFSRTDGGDGASEILTVVRIDGEEGLYVEVCAGPEIGDDFVGLYDLEGDQLPSGKRQWEAADASEVSEEMIEGILVEFAHGLTTVERLYAA